MYIIWASLLITMYRHKLRKHPMPNLLIMVCPCTIVTAARDTGTREARWWRSSWMGTARHGAVARLGA